MGNSVNPLLTNESMSVHFSSDSWKHTSKHWSLLFISKRKKYRIGNFVPFSKISNWGVGGETLSSIKETYRQSTQAPLLWSPHSLKIQGLGSILGQRSGALSRCPPMTSPMFAPEEGPAHKGMSSFTQMWTQLKFTAECLWPHSACEYSSSYMGLYLQSLDRNNST